MPTPLPWRIVLAATLVSVVSVLEGCTTTFAPRRIATPEELHGLQQKSIGGLTVQVAVLSDEQAARHFGADLAAEDVQALWLSVSNASDRKFWFIRNLLDPDFYTPEEVAVLVKGRSPRATRERLQQHLRDESIRVQISPRTVTEGFVFLPRAEGGRYVDIRLQADAFEEDVVQRSTAGLGPAMRPGAARELRFDFAVPLPDGDFDYERLDPAKTYAGQVLPDLDSDQLRSALAQLPCCTTDESGTRQGDPLNIAIIGDVTAVLNSLSRSGWSFTHRIDFRTIRREIGAAIAGNAYLVAPVSNLYVFGRRQDVSLQRARRSIAQRNHMRLWLAPFRFEGRQVWVGQVSRDIGVKLTPKTPTLTTHVIDPEVDSAREYLLHSLLAERFVERFGFVRGSAAVPRTQPRYNLVDDPYFTDGMRLAIVLALEEVSPEQTRSLLWEQSAAPVAEGQSEAAMRNVRPIEQVSGGQQPR